MVAWHEVPGIRKKKEPVPEGRCDYLFARYSTNIVFACARFRDGVVGAFYTIILSLRDGSPLFCAIPGTSCLATLMRPSGTIGRRAITVCGPASGRDALRRVLAPARRIARAILFASGT